MPDENGPQHTVLYLPGEYRFHPIARIKEATGFDPWINCVAMLEEAGKELDAKIRSVISHVENEAT